MRRTLTRDDEFGGPQLRAGDKALMLYEAANFDEAQFAGPEPFRQEFFQFLLGAVEPRRGKRFHGGHGGVERLLDGRICAGANDGINALLLLGG